MLTYKEQVDLSKKADKLSEKLYSMEDKQFEYHNTENGYLFAIQDLEKVIKKAQSLGLAENTITQLEEAKQQLEISKQKFEENEERKAFYVEYGALHRYINDQIESHKQYILLYIDIFSAKDLNLPCCLYYKGSKKSRQPFFDTFQNTLEAYCKQNNVHEPQRKGYKQIWSVTCLDSLKIAENAQTVLEYMQAHLG